MPSLHASDALTIPPLVGGGIMLSYRCTNQCRHCLYRCGPAQPDEWMTEDVLDRTIAALQGEPALRSLHLAGGEPFLRFDLLEWAVRRLSEAGLPLDYVETNAFWAVDDATTAQRLEALRDAGLPSLLVSASMFHNEFVPFEYTRRCVEIGAEVFGSGGVIVYLPNLFHVLEKMPDPGRRRSLKEFCNWAGIAPNSPEVPAMYHVIPAGRAPDALRDCYPPRPARAFSPQRCAGQLLHTEHFHIDHRGNLFTGLCAGLSPADVDDLHPSIDAESHPLFTLVATEGPLALARLAREKHGYEESPAGYVSACDLCFQVRRCLASTGEYAELRPRAYYQSV